MPNKTILIADDEERILRLIYDFLTASGYNVLTADDGEKALEVFNAHQKEINLAVIDIMMPNIDGWEVTRKIRKTSNVPIIMLSARSEEFDMLSGFEAGIDEYVTKPFSPAVLVKRIEAIINRNEKSANINGQHTSGLSINEQAYTAYLDGKQLELPLKEFELLLHLYKNAGIVLSRDALLDAVWGYDYFGDNRTVDSHIARLRTKLGDWGATHLKTIYGMGYKLEIE